MKRKILAIVMTFAMIVGLMPVMAFAENQNGPYVFIFDNYSGNKSNFDAVQYMTSNSQTTWTTVPTATSSGESYQVSLGTNADTSVSLKITLAKTSDIEPSLGLGPDKTAPTFSKTTDGNNYVYTVTMTEGAHLEFQSTGGGGQEDPQFDGKAYFIWKGDNGEICKKLFTNLNQSDSSKITYIPEKDVVDGNNQFDVSKMAQHDDEWYHWVWYGKIEQIGSGWNWAELDANLNTLMDNNVLIQPCNSKNGQHTVCTFGDRNFKATIYDSEFVGVKFSDKRDDYTYFPDYWNPTFFSSTLDVSETKEDETKVVNYTAPFCENTIRLSAVDANSSDATSPVIKSITPMVEQPEAAFEIDKDENKPGEWTIKYNSNFYNQTVFKIEIANGNNEPALYYVRINREALKVMDIKAKEFYANFYYAYDEDEQGTRTTYKDYDVYMEIIYSDGTRTLEKVDAAQTIINDQRETIGTNYAVSGGKNLNMSQYKIPIATDKQAERVIFTVTKAGATSIESDTFIGGYMGVGAGLEYDVESRTIIY